MRKWVTIAAVVAVAAVLVGGTLLLNPKRPSASTSAGDKTAAKGSPGKAVASTPTAPPPAEAGKQKPTAVAKGGAALQPVRQPPTKTLAMLDPKAADAGSAYGVTFEPYGTGPGPNSLVIHVLTSKPVGAVKKPFEFKGANVLTSLAPGSSTAVKAGGRYEGTLKLVEKDGLLVPELSDVRRVKT